MKILDHVNIDSENPLYLIFNNVEGYIEETNGNKYLIFASTDKNIILQTTNIIHMSLFT